MTKNGGERSKGMKSDTNDDDNNAAKRRGETSEPQSQLTNDVTANDASWSTTRGQREFNSGADVGGPNVFELGADVTAAAAAAAATAAAAAAATVSAVSNSAIEAHQVRSRRMSFDTTAREEGSGSGGDGGDSSHYGQGGSDGSGDDDDEIKHKRGGRRRSSAIPLAADHDRFSEALSGTATNSPPRAHLHRLRSRLVDLDDGESEDYRAVDTATAAAAAAAANVTSRDGARQRWPVGAMVRRATVGSGSRDDESSDDNDDSGTRIEDLRHVGNSAMVQMSRRRSILRREREKGVSTSGSDSEDGEVNDMAKGMDYGWSLDSGRKPQRRPSRIKFTTSDISGLSPSLRRLALRRGSQESVSGSSSQRRSSVKGTLDSSTTEPATVESFLRQASKHYVKKKATRIEEKLKESRSFLKEKLNDPVLARNAKEMMVDKSRSLFESWKQTVNQVIKDASTEAIEVINMDDTDPASAGDVDTVIASAMAPLRLRFMFVCNAGMIFHHIVFSTWALRALVSDWQLSCDVKLSYVSLKVFTLIWSSALTIALFCRFYIHRRIRRFYDETNLANMLTFKKRAKFEPKELRKSHRIANNIQSIASASRKGREDMRRTRPIVSLMSEHAASGEQSVMLYRKLHRSIPARILAVGYVFFLFCRIVSTAVFVRISCSQACYQVHLERLNAVAVAEFAFTATFHVLVVIIIAFKLYLGEAGIMRKAKAIDDKWWPAVKVAQTFVEQFVVEGDHVVRIAKRNLRRDVQKLQAERQDELKALRVVDEEIVRVEAMLRRLAQLQDQQSIITINARELGETVRSLGSVPRDFGNSMVSVGSSVAEQLSEFASIRKME